MLVMFIITIIIHETGHLIIARRLISWKADIRYFLNFKYLGVVNIPTNLSYPEWKGVVVAVAGPLSATIVLHAIWLNTSNPLLALSSGFFATYQLVYTVFEPISYLGLVPLWYSILPLAIAGIWLLFYASKLGGKGIERKGALVKLCPECYGRMEKVELGTDYWVCEDCEEVREVTGNN